MKRATREWVKKAETDYRAAVELGRKKPPMHDMVCFHCQQCAEKYLKALLEELSLAVAKTHDLVLLLATLIPHHPSLRLLRRGLKFLNEFAVDPRYPGRNPTKRKAVAAIRWAGRVRAETRSLLGLRPPRPGRKKSP
jgi:HEPN domain-containing protein